MAYDAIHTDYAACDRAWVEVNLRARGVAPAIIERVARLNPEPETGRRLRGIHYKDDSLFVIMSGSIRKGEFLRRYGRGAYAALPSQAVTKRGRREFIMQEYARG